MKRFRFKAQQKGTVGELQARADDEALNTLETAVPLISFFAVFILGVAAFFTEICLPLICIKLGWIGLLI